MRRAAVGLSAMTLLAAACGGPSGPQVTPPPGAVVIAAQGSVFQPASLPVTAGQGFPVFFDNRDTVPHNVRVVDGARQTVTYTEVFGGPAGRAVDVPPLAAGTYKILCDVHPEMVAELIAAP